MTSRIIDRVKLELKLSKKDFHPVQLCMIYKNILKKYNYDFEVKKGYINIDGFGSPKCFTYFWLEDSSNTKLDPLRIEGNDLTYFFTDDILAGVDCIDEFDTISEANSIWEKINTRDLFNSNDLQCYNTILKKHPNKNLVS